MRNMIESILPELTGCQGCHVEELNHIICKENDKMAKGMDRKNFEYSKDDIITILEESTGEIGLKVYNTFLEQEAIRWKRGKKNCFQQSLVDDGLEYFSYVKFYIGDDGKKYALVAGKSGSKSVNKSSGCDLSFSIKPEHGAARKWLEKHHKSWCQTEILIVWKNNVDIKESEKKAFEIEAYLQKTFGLLGS